MTTTTLGGIRRFDPAHIPDTYTTNGGGLNGLRAQIDDFARATTAPLAYYDDDRDEYVEADDFAAIVNPAWLGDGLADAPTGDALWWPRSRNYDVANPDDAFIPLIHALADRGIGEVFGEAREYRHGGEFHMDLFFPEVTVPWPDTLASPSNDALNGNEDRPEMILGITTGADHLGKTTLYARAIAYDPSTDTVLRNLTEKETRRHVKPASDSGGRSANEVAAWWKAMLAKLNTVSDSLYRAIHDATEYFVDFDGIPRTPLDYYTALGIPATVAEDAYNYLGGTSIDNDLRTAWDLHSALMWALEHHFDGQTDGNAMGSHVSTANKILFRPASAEADAANVWYRTEMDADKQQTTLTGENVADVYREREQSAAEATNQYRSMKDRMKALLKEARESDDDDGDDQPLTTAN